MGFGPFFFQERKVRALASLAAIVDQAVEGMGFEPVLTQVSNQGKLVRVFIDRAGGVTVDDCADVSRHLERLLAVEGVSYDRMEVSSPGLDRPLRGVRDYLRFAGQKAEVRMRTPNEKGQRRFVGLLGEVRPTALMILVEGKPIALDLNDIDRAKLAPDF